MILAIGAALLAPATVKASAPPVVLVYTEQGGEADIEHTFVIEPAAVYAIELVSRGGGPEILQRLRTCPELSVESWYYRDPGSGTEIQAVRGEATIRLRGRYREAEIARTLTISSAPCYQLFPHGLERHALDAGKPVRFWAVGVEGIGAMRAGSFRAAVAGVQEVLWGNQAVRAIHMRISLAGPASVLWRGDCWYRPGDRRNLISRSDRGPGSRPIRTELTTER